MAQIFIPGTAAPSDVLAGKSFSAGASYQAAGAMPNKAGVDTGASAVTTDGTGGLFMKMPSGYYDSTSRLTAWNGDFYQDYILSGRNVFGVNGTAKRVATGTGTTDGNARLTVSGLTFLASKVVVLQNNLQFFAYYDSTITNGHHVQRQISGGTGVINWYFNSPSYPDSPLYLSATGFCFYAGLASLTSRWYAIE
ncbi:hypothetical protein [Cohnella sp. GCM10012308]|uniref:hypothetical protein n=1 Tax=Cohnella sp. GCM10012308 TaxID=3317329 RepID=UPI0036119A7C